MQLYLERERDRDLLDRDKNWYWLTFCKLKHVMKLLNLLSGCFLVWWMSFGFCFRWCLGFILLQLVTRVYEDEDALETYIRSDLYAAYDQTKWVIFPFILEYTMYKDMSWKLRVMIVLDKVDNFVNVWKASVYKQ